MLKSARHLGAVTLLLVLSACSTTTQLSSSHPEGRVVVKGKEVALPASHNMQSTSFGNFEFKATSATSEKTFYGVLPLQFKGGRLALDILFFAPAAFGNLRAAYPFYEFDVDNQVVRFKNKQGDSWHEYKPTPEEAERARRFYEQPAPVGASN